MVSTFGTEPSVEDMDVQPMKDEFAGVMARISRTRAPSDLEELAKRASDLWREMTWRGVEFK